MAPEDYPFLLSKLKEYETAVEKNGPRYSDGALIYLIQRFGPLAKDAVPILKRLVEKYSGALADYPSIANTLIQINTPDAEEIVQTIMCHDRTWKFNVHEELRRINGQGCKNISVSSDGRSYIVKE